MSETHPLDLPDYQTTMGPGGPDLFAVHRPGFPGTSARARFRTFSTVSTIGSVGGCLGTLACAGCVTTSRF